MENEKVLDRVVINLIKDILKVGDVVVIDNVIGEVEFVGKIGVIIKRGEGAINFEIKKIKSIEVLNK